MVIKGKLITCKREVKEFDGKKTKEKLWISLAEVKLTKDQLAECAAVFEDAGKKMTPEWVKKFDGYVNVSTEYDLPCRDVDGNEYASVERLIREDKYPYMSADIELALNLKKEKQAIYPVALVFKTEGKAFNPFAEFDNAEED